MNDLSIRSENLIPTRSQDWFFTPEGDPRGYIQPHALKELWFHTGTACNLSCSFCLEGSGPGDRRLELVKLKDVQPFIDEALALQVDQFSFTGGEPFLAKDIVKILEYATQFRPCMVLTNGTDPLRKRMHQLESLRQAAHPVKFRISLDSPVAEEHDSERGAGSFDQAVDSLVDLHRMGFAVSVARHMEKDEDTVKVEQQYRQLLEKHGLPEDLNIVAFPDFAVPGSHPLVPQVTEHCMTTYQDEQSRRQFMCAFSKMVVKQKGRMRVYACTLVDDDDEYDLGATLAEAMDHRISMRHHRCYSCFAFGSSCSEG